MTRNRTHIAVLFAVSLALSASAPAAPPTAAAEAAWQKYLRLSESRIEQDLQHPTTARPGTQVVVERLKTTDNGKPIEAPDALIHHWKGSVFVPGVNLARVLSFAQDYNQHSRFFAEVQKSRLVSRDGDKFSIFYRLKRTKVITVYYNTEHSVLYRTLGTKEAASRSMTTRIAELDAVGTPGEREKAPGEDHGFLWRLNSYWRFTERDGGVVIECESISLSRDIPTGLAWLVRGYVESIPRESLVNTLSSFGAGARKN